MRGNELDNQQTNFDAVLAITIPMRGNEHGTRTLTAPNRATSDYDPHEG